MCRMAERPKCYDGNNQGDTEFLGAPNHAIYQLVSSRVVAVTECSHRRRVNGRFQLLNQVTSNGEKHDSQSGSCRIERNDSVNDFRVETSESLTPHKFDSTRGARRQNTKQALPEINSRSGDLSHQININNRYSNIKLNKTKSSSHPISIITIPSINGAGHRSTLHNTTINESGCGEPTNTRGPNSVNKNTKLSRKDHNYNGCVLSPRCEGGLPVDARNIISTVTRHQKPRTDSINGKEFHILRKFEEPDQQVSGCGRRQDARGDNKAVNGTEKSGARRPVLCPETDNKQLLCRFVENDVFGANNVVPTSFGLTKLTYLDCIASGRPLRSFEKYIRQHVLTAYSNTHTEVNHISRQTSQFREEARSIIRECVNASNDDVVIFTGSGATTAVNKLIHALNLRRGLDEPCATVFLGPFEHHSNMLPWRETGAEVITVPQTSNGLIDMKYLNSELERRPCKPKRLLIGSFSAASNVTGILTDVDAVASLMHRHGGLAFFDYACAAPYIEIDMNPPHPQAYKDAVFVSPHKFMGGPQTPGMLIAKRVLFLNTVPHGLGGGTVVLVRRTSHRYVSNIEVREEGGTPAIVESIRAGLAFKLKAAFTSSFILGRELEMMKLARTAWSQLPGLVILGSLHVDRLPIFSMLFPNRDTGRLLHHDFIARILNDVFGLQVRSGCACAGPYGMDLMGISEKMGEVYERLIMPISDSKDSNSSHCRHGHASNQIFKPGFVRLSFPYFMSESCFNFVIKAIQTTSENGWLLLPMYNFDRDTGNWWHTDPAKNMDIQNSLTDISFKAGNFDLTDHSVSHSQGHTGVSYPQGHQSTGQHEVYSDCMTSFPLSQTGGFTYEEILKRAERIFTGARKTHRPDLFEPLCDRFEGQEESLRWFMLPSEAVDILNGRQVKYVYPEDLPFTPEAMRQKRSSRR